MSAFKPVLAVSMGDCNGIGPEIALRAAISPAVRRVCKPVLVGSIDVFESTARLCRLRLNLREVFLTSPDVDGAGVSFLQARPFELSGMTPGRPTIRGGLFAGSSIEQSVSLWKKGFADGIVTAPTSKSVMNKAGFRFPGQTEMVATLAGAKGALMMLVAGTFRVALATVHVPHRSVSGALSVPLIVRKLTALNRALRNDFRIASPRIAVLGLNPHAGEEGLLGSEEGDIIRPAIQMARRSRILAEGPFPADGFFGMHAHRKFDGILAMYHDQGLIPLKMSGFNIGVNFTAGLPIVRTSPDHGTAYELAGRGTANPASMIEAIKLASEVIHNRRSGHRR